MDHFTSEKEPLVAAQANAVADGLRAQGHTLRLIDWAGSYMILIANRASSFDDMTDEELMRIRSYAPNAASKVVGWIECRGWQCEGKVQWFDMEYVFWAAPRRSDYKATRKATSVKSLLSKSKSWCPITTREQRDAARDQNAQRRASVARQDAERELSKAATPAALIALLDAVTESQIEIPEAARELVSAYMDGRPAIVSDAA